MRKTANSLLIFPFVMTILLVMHSDSARAGVQTGVTWSDQVAVADFCDSETEDKAERFESGDVLLESISCMDFDQLPAGLFEPYVWKVLEISELVIELPNPQADCVVETGMKIPRRRRSDQDRQFNFAINTQDLAF